MLEGGGGGGSGRMLPRKTFIKMVRSGAIWCNLGVLKYVYANLK